MVIHIKKKITIPVASPLDALKAATKIASVDPAIVLGTENGQGGGEKKRKPADLVELVSKLVEVEPHDHDGHLWAARPRSFYQKELNVSAVTLWRWIEKPPFVARKANVHGKTWTLIRVGEPDPKSVVHIARTLGKIFIDHMKFLESQNMLNKPVVMMMGQPAKKQIKAFDKISPADYGRLNGIAKELPDGEQEKIFRFVLKNWPVFMSAVDHKIFEANNAAELEGEPHPFKKQYYSFPSIRVIRRFCDCAVTAYDLHLQGNF